MEFMERSMEMDTRNDFSRGSVSENIIRMAIPMTVAQLINILYNIVDRIYIARLPEASSLAITGIGICLPIISIILAFGNLFGTGGAPLTSIARGRGDNKRGELLLGNSFTMLLLTGIVITIAGLAVMRPLLYLFGASNATYPYASAYMSIYLIGTVFVMISFGMNFFINAQGFARTGMMTVLVGALLNIVLDPVFIFAFHMGIRGAAIATVISQGVSAVWVLRFLTGSKAILRIRRDSMRPDARLLQEIFSLGLSGFIMLFTNALVQIMCNTSLESLGGDLYVGVMTVISSIREVVSLPIIGITNAAQPVLGFNYGAGYNNRVKAGIRFTSIVSVVYTIGVWILLRAFPGFFISIFNTEPALLNAGIPLMNIYYFGFFMMSLQFAGQSVFVGLGQSRYAVFFSLLRKVVIVIPLVLLLPRIGGLGIRGVFAAEPVSNFIGGSACYLTMMHVVYRKLLKDNA